MPGRVNLNMIFDPETAIARGESAYLENDKTFPARRDLLPEAVRARVAEFSEWFGVPTLKLTVRKGSVYVTDELVSWCNINGASIDWILLGEVRGMAATFREKYAVTPQVQEICDTIAKLRSETRLAFVSSVEDLAAGRISTAEFEAFWASQLKGEPAPDGFVSIPILRDRPSLDRFMASRRAEGAKNLTPRS